MRKDGSMKTSFCQGRKRIPCLKLREMRRNETGDRHLQKHRTKLTISLPYDTPKGTGRWSGWCFCLSSSGSIPIFCDQSSCDVSVKDWRDSIPSWFTQPLPDEPHIREIIKEVQSSCIKLIQAEHAEYMTQLPISPMKRGIWIFCKYPEGYGYVTSIQHETFL